MKNKTLLGYYAFQWKASSRIQLIITQGCFACHLQQTKNISNFLDTKKERHGIILICCIDSVSFI